MALRREPMAVLKACVCSRFLDRASTSPEKVPQDPGFTRTCCGQPPEDILGVTVNEGPPMSISPVDIGTGSKIWHFSHILPRTKIGKNCIVGQNVDHRSRRDRRQQLQIPEQCLSVYPGVDPRRDGVFCGPSCVFTNVINPRAEIERKTEFKPTLVKRNLAQRSAQNATIVCNHDLGQYSFIAAGAVATKDVPDFGMMVGTPARRAGWMSRAGVGSRSGFGLPH